MTPEPHVLLLGGTGEAAWLARRLASRSDLRLTTSLAGATRVRRALPGSVVVGGFGGAAALRRYLETQRLRALVDATHPFARRMARNARRAALVAAVPRIKLWREPWAPVAGDRWVMAEDVADAARLAATLGRRPLVSLGSRGLGGFGFTPFELAIVRAIECPRHLPSNAEWLAARPPFDVAAELALFTERAIDVLVTKNSGGEATRAKLDVARALRLPVVMIRRPEPPPGPRVCAPEAALAWLDQVLRSRPT